MDLRYRSNLCSKNILPEIPQVRTFQSCGRMFVFLLKGSNFVVFFIIAYFRKYTGAFCGISITFSLWVRNTNIVVCKI